MRNAIGDRDGRDRTAAAEVCTVSAGTVAAGADEELEAGADETALVAVVSATGTCSIESKSV